MCLDPLNNPKRAYCSTGCAHVSNVLLNPDYAAQCLIGREGDPSGALHCSECGSPEWLPPSMVKCTFQVDHIIGVAEGGGCCYLDNLRALCHAPPPRPLPVIQTLLPTSPPNLRWPRRKPKP